MNQIKKTIINRLIEEGLEINNERLGRIDAFVQKIDACEETECIVEPIKTICSIPNEIREQLTNKQQQLFKKAFNRKFNECTEDDFDNFLRHQTSMIYAQTTVKNYIEAPYDKNSDLPDNVKNPLPSAAQTIWRNVFNQSIANGDTEEVARKKAWAAVKKGYKKNKDGDWVKK